MYLASNLAFLMEKSKHNPNSLSEATKVPQPTIFRIINNQVKDPRVTSLQPLADFFGVTLSDLRGKDLRGNYNVTPGPENRGDVPVVSWVTAGNWAEVEDPYSRGVAEEWRPCPRAHSDRTFALRVRGVSMENLGGRHSYSPGDIIFVDPDKSPENGSRVIVRLEDDKEATFKQLVIEGEHSYLVALNPSWPEKIIEIAQNATICGVVIGKWTDE